MNVEVANSVALGATRGHHRHGQHSSSGCGMCEPASLSHHWWPRRRFPGQVCRANHGHTATWSYLRPGFLLFGTARCLRAGLPEVLKANLMGSLHWCLLLVLGQSMLAGGHGSFCEAPVRLGLKQKMLEFNVDGAAALMSCQARHRAQSLLVGHEMRIPRAQMSSKQAERRSTGRRLH